MYRRTYLTGLAGSLAASAGCLRSVTGMGSGVRRTVSVERTAATGIDLRAEMREASVTVDHTATVRLTWTNPGSTTTAIEIGSGDWYEPLFSHTISNGQRKSTGIVLVPPHYEKQKRSETCWKPAKGDYWGGSGASERTTLGSGESIHNDYDVWTNLDVAGCLPPGTYDFGHFDGPSPTWRVTLKIEK